VKDICSTAKNQIVWQDRYFTHTTFHRFLSDVPASTSITLVTWPKSKCRGAKDERRYEEFLDISRLFALERGPSGYRLVTDEDFHSRWLRCDNTLFNLGDSIKELGEGTTFTIGKLDPTPENFKHLDESINRGTELFGPTNTSHP
jgi:hypothetical protein